MVDIRKKAEEMGITIIEKENYTDIRGAVFKKDDKWYIMVNSNDSEERKSFTIAHELGEIILNDNNELSNDAKHKMANLIAADLLMPEDIFKNDILLNNDLYQLKKKYENCSYEAIARRMLKFMPYILTIFDNKKIYIRIASDSINFPSSLAEIENEVAEKCYQIKNCCEKDDDNLNVKGYYIDESRGVERVILLTEVLDIN